MLLKAAICDDDAEIGLQIEDMLEKVSAKTGTAFDVDTFETGETLCRALESGITYDLIFLDIELPKINGIEVGAKIRNEFKDDFLPIIYISGKSAYSMDLFDIRPLHFLIKPLTFEKIEKVMNTFLRLKGFWAGVFTYKTRRDTHKVKIGDIMYLENDRKEIILHMSNDSKARFYGGIKKVYEEQLKKYDFLFIHAAFLVNYDHVMVFKWDEVVLNNGTALSISQAKRKEIRDRQQEIERGRI